MKYSVFLTEDAVRDLEDIKDYLTASDSSARAAYVLDRIEQSIQRLAEQPQRGRIPRELQETGMKEFREIFFKPYRILYRIIDADVFVLLIADGRRDMQTLLQRRLLRE
jgi:toxin ParE1/3/4